MKLDEHLEVNAIKASIDAYEAVARAARDAELDA